VKSFSYVLRDGLIIAAFGYLALQLPFENIGVSGMLLWALYAFWQGSAMTGLWVIAHECGHGAFSDSHLLNDVVGLVLHTVLFVPYFSWQYSHARHHAKTNHLVDGESHTPPTYKGYRAYQKLFDLLGEDGFAVYQILTHLLLGWPMYLILNATGARRTYEGARIPKGFVLDHFRPSSLLFPPNWRARVAISTCALLCWAVALFFAAQSFGWKRVCLMYWGPYFVTNAWLVLYTWLQHTEPGVPHFGDSDWTWVKGAALGTVDRPYGIFDWMHHHIGSTHVAHHLFCRLPHYHAVEATVHVKQVLGALYNYQGSNVVQSIVRVAKTCHFVDGIEGEQVYRSFNASNSHLERCKGA
jgi:omega-6 fatty acid desaturase (delta-12 desaturase)